MSETIPVELTILKLNQIVLDNHFKLNTIER